MATRREFMGSGVLTVAPEAWPIPREVAGVKLPESKLARDATDFTRGLSAPFVFNHVLRTYLFGELVGRAKGLKFDSELFYLGAVLHDLGQNERFMGQQRFEVDGADAAAEFRRRGESDSERRRSGTLVTAYALTHRRLQASHNAGTLGRRDSEKMGTLSPGRRCLLRGRPRLRVTYLTNERAAQQPGAVRAHGDIVDPHEQSADGQRSICRAHFEDGPAPEGAARHQARAAGGDVQQFRVPAGRPASSCLRPWSMPWGSCRWHR